MGSLTAHLRRPDNHARLAFHPECPICRQERLAGALPDDAIVGRRRRALLAASVIAFASTAPTAVLAAEPDQEYEGATAPEQVANDDTGATPDLDPGGQATELPLDAGAAPEADATPDATAEAAPLEQAPAPEDQVAGDAGDVTDTMSTLEPQEPAAAAPSLPPSPESATGAPEPNFAPSAAVPEAPVAIEQRPQADIAEPRPESKPAAAEPPALEPKHRRGPKSQPPHSGTMPAGTNSAPGALPLEPVELVTETVMTPTRAARSDSVTVARGRATRRADGFHVVKRGESLWSIAKDLVGDDASLTGMAREVNRLSELNAARIGTGDPDLLIAGTRIALR